LELDLLVGGEACDCALANVTATVTFVLKGSEGTILMLLVLCWLLIESDECEYIASEERKLDIGQSSCLEQVLISDDTQVNETRGAQFCWICYQLPLVTMLSEGSCKMTEFRGNLGKFE
jgi:hypothetical protein